MPRVRSIIVKVMEYAMLTLIVIVKELFLGE